MTKLLVDANNMANRAYFAFRDCQAFIDGQHVNSSVIYGFTKFIVDIAIKYSTHDISIIWDSGSTERRQLYPEYKDGRNKEHYVDMISQFDDLERLLSMMGMKQIRAMGYEADDVIFTITETDSTEDIKLIVSSDKDMALFLKSNVMIYNPDSRKIIKEEDVDKIYGVSKDRLLEFFALRGDKADNIAGVPGIGDKTAQKILAQFNTVDEAIQASMIPGIQPSKLKALKENIDAFNLAKRLISPILVPQEELVISPVIQDLDLSLHMLNKYQIKTIRIGQFFQLLEGINGKETST